MEFNTVPEAVADLKKGKLIVVVDDKSRENEGDVVFAAAKSTPAKINFLAKNARGLICVALSPETAERLKLPLMVQDNLSRHETAFTITVEARNGTTTGISARDRSVTARALADDSLGPDDFVRPGHIFPIKAKKGGVLVRAGHTEAAVDLVNMAGLGQTGVICEIMNEDGSMARLGDCMRFAKKHDMKIISVEDLIGYRRMREKLVRRVASPRLVTSYGEFRSFLYEDVIHGKMHLALVRGEINPQRSINVRVHSECQTGDVFASLRCDCGVHLQRGLEFIGQHEGVFLYMRHSDPDRNFLIRMKAYDLEDAGHEEGGKLSKTSGHHASLMDQRTYGIGAQILFDLGVRNLNLLTNHPKRIQGLEGYGLKLIRQIPMPLVSRHVAAAGLGRRPVGKSENLERPRPEKSALKKRRLK